ncbi:replicative DNA helicase [Hyalangium rubrum]|uniref:Replicative DNA helicase n=1 Tax=Hyalangium rubrum TaxID=3103134 RepID=A0ABU5HJF1_9BACT|nr:replicative DNA helicase [Hyalangium sp. s54d21]MDY7233287.1 replicative DNA helicase [Hyalangium sp. s54d21]
MTNVLDGREGRRVHEDLAAERAVLGAVLADNTLIASVAEAVHPDDFASPAHSAIFAAMLKLDSTQRQVDHLTLAEELKLAGHLATVGGPAYLMALDQGVPLAHNAVQYANIVKDQALRRRLVAVGREIVEMASQETGDVEVILDESERRLFNLAEKRREGDLRAVSELMEQTLTLLDKMKASASGVTGLSTGFVDLDMQLTGLHAGELIILAARPGIGKTSLVMNIAMHAALNKEDPKAVAIFSLEMPADQLLMRLLASSARVDMKKLRGGRLTANDEEKFQEMAGELYNAPIYIDDSGGLSPFDLRAKARRLKQKDPRLSLIVIDYLQLMHQKGKVESRQLEVSEISRSLKQLAKELEVPVIALSQLNRKVEERKGGQPMLSDLRESGSIEQDADVVMFIHREEPEEGEGGGEQRASSVIPVELIIAKQRNGPVGSVPLVFLSEFTRFESRARGDFQ